jgi:serine/threonine protein kinase
MSQADQKYVLAKRIARGGMAEIYLGKAIGEGGFAKLCAIKRVLPHFAKDEEFIKMFRDEANITKRLTHANIVQVYGFEELDDSYALIMEFIDGADLRTLLASSEQAKTRLPVPVCLYIIAETARGLHFAHTKKDDVSGKPLGIIHRDISPQNVLLSYEGEVKITDFGIADADAESKSTDTKPGIVKGKYAYMSPEQVAAKSLTPSSDVFALGIVLWEMLAMSRLFQGKTEVETIRMVQAARLPRKLSEYNREIDAGLEAIVEKALARDVAKRYPTAESLERDIRRYLNVKYPDFTATDLSGFIKKTLSSNFASAQEDIKAALTASNVRMPLGRASSSDPQASPDLNGSLSLARTRTGMSRAGSAHPLQGLPAGLTGARGNTGRPTPATRHSGAAFADWSRKKAARFRMITLAGMLALALAGGGIFLVNSKFMAKTMVELVVATTPTHVHFIIDGKSPFKEYIRTPVRLKLAPGPHDIVIRREGYQDESFRINAQAGDKLTQDRVILSRSGRNGVASLKVQTLGAPKGSWIMVSAPNAQGFFSGLAPLRVDDLVADTAYTVSLFPNWPDRRGEIQCKLPKASWVRPLLLTIDTSPGTKKHCPASSQ